MTPNPGGHFLEAFLVLSLLISLTLSRPEPDPEPDEEATTSWIHERLPEEDNVLGTPFNLTASNITASSLSLGWAMNTSYNKIRGYRVFYKHNSYEDIKTIEGPDPAYKLTGLSPYTMYEVWVMPIGVDGTEKGQASEKIFKTTDTASPSAPFITNVTCYETQKIYIEWKRPSTYYRNVDYYYYIIIIIIIIIIITGMLTITTSTTRQQWRAATRTMFRSRPTLRMTSASSWRRRMLTWPMSIA